MARKEAKYDAGKGDRPELNDYLKVMNAWAGSYLRDGPQRTTRILERILTFPDTPGYQHISPTIECYQIMVRAFAPKFPSHAETWLMRMENNWKKQLETDEPWSSEILQKSYNVCLDSWSRWSNFSKKGRSSPARAMALLERMKNLSELDSIAGPDSFSYSCVLRALARIGNAKDAQMIMAEMEQLYEEDPLTPKVQPNSMDFSSVIDALSKSNGGEKAALEAEKILTHMVELHSSGTNRNAKPNAYTYEGVLTTWAKSRTGMKGPRRAEAIFEHMCKLNKAGNHGVKPLTINVNAVVDAWSICRGGVEAAKKCESILYRMDPDGLFSKKDHNLGIWPNIETVNSVISAWAHCGTKDAPGHAERILEFLDKWNAKAPENRRIQPTVQSYNTIIASYARSAGTNSARRAEALLYRLVNLGTKDDRGTALEKSFGLVISCWSKSSDPMAAERADQLLKILEKNHKEGISRAKPNLIIYSQVIAAWSKSRQKGASQKAKAIFDHMMESNDVELYPNTITFNSMLNTLANSNRPEVPKQAKEILDQMYELQKDDEWDVAPNSRSMISYMTCLAKQSKDDASNAQKAEDLIDRMLAEVESGNSKMKPDSFAFTTAINAWAWSASESAGDGIIRVIDRMEALFYRRIITSRPHAICYNAAVRYFVGRGELKQADKLVSRMEAAFVRGIKEAAPDRLTYAALLNAYAQSDETTSIEDALELFRRQKAQSTAGNKGAKPNNICYNMVMARLAKSSDSAVRSKVLSLFEEMKKLAKDGDNTIKPDAVSYSTVMNVIAKSPEKGSAARAIMLLTEMESRYNAGDETVKPNLFSFNSVLNALSKARTKAAAIKAEELLAKMNEMSKSYPAFVDVRPDLISFTAVIDAWAGIKVEGAAKRADATLRCMERLSAKGDGSCQDPDVVAYNKVLLSWARHSQPEKAHALLQEMEESSKVNPDGFSYKTVLLAWSRQAGGAARAEALLDLMEKKSALGKEHLKPDLLCYKAVAAAWEDAGASHDKQEEFSNRITAFQQ